ncbi:MULTISPECIES: PKD domain-containing protein [Streptomyces]|uniref:PKD domain-containing protein n=1 Tax=Streptomyces TaxID=1883 RepID=UPI0016792B44|nr:MULTISPECIES: PKD domain-containing protein [Streptomyces]MBD3575284.1 PKD domain-containing protein [Streptomyces sp. KD18]
MTAALVAAGLGLVPGMASAAERPGTAVGQGLTKSAAGAGAGKGERAAAQTWHSPAERTVRTVRGAAEGKAVAPQVAGVGKGNPDLAVQLDGAGYTALGLHLRTKITSVDDALEVVVDWGDGKTEKQTVKGSAEPDFAHSYAEVGQYQVSVKVTDAVNGVVAENGFAYLTPGSDFTPHAPTRLLDTRDGTGVQAGKVAARGTTRVKIAGNARIPADVRAVVLNVTVTNTTTDGHVTVFPGKGSTRPNTSNLNYAAGQSVPNLVIVPVGTDGYVELFNGGWGAVDLLADVTGYFTRSSSSGYTPMAPTRFVDTRTGVGTTKGGLASRSAFSTRIGGLKGVPADVTAVALNVTVTGPRQAGHLSVYPGGGQPPTTSSLNFAAGETVANAVIVPVGPDGTISVFNGAWAETDVVVDVVGHYAKDGKAAYRPYEPRRWFDTRDPASWWYGGRLPAQGYVSMWGDPEARGGEAYVLNTTVTNAAEAGFLSVAPSPFPWLHNDQPGAPVPPSPDASTLNWTAGKTVANLVQASGGEHGILNFWNQGWKDVDLIVDTFGAYEAY